MADRTVRAARGPAPRIHLRLDDGRRDRVVPIEVLRREALLHDGGRPRGSRPPGRHTDRSTSTVGAVLKGAREITVALARVLEALGRVVLVCVGFVLWWAFLASPVLCALWLVWWWLG